MIINQVILGCCGSNFMKNFSSARQRRILRASHPQLRAMGGWLVMVFLVPPSIILPNQIDSVISPSTYSTLFNRCYINPQYFEIQMLQIGRQDIDQQNKYGSSKTFDDFGPDHCDVVIFSHRGVRNTHQSGLLIERRWEIGVQTVGVSPISQGFHYVHYTLVILFYYRLDGLGINVIPKPITPQYHNIVGFGLELVVNGQERAVTLHSHLVREVELLLLFLDLVQESLALSPVDTINRVSEMDTIQNSCLRIEGENTNCGTSQLSIQFNGSAHQGLRILNIVLIVSLKQLSNEVDESPRVQRSINSEFCPATDSISHSQQIVVSVAGILSSFVGFVGMGDHFVGIFEIKPWFLHCFNRMVRARI